MNTIQNLSFDSVTVSFNNNGYLNASAIAKHFGKRVPDFIKTEQNQEYIAALAEHLSKTKKIVLDKNQLVIVKHGYILNLLSISPAGLTRASQFGAMNKLNTSFQAA